jgi:CDP-paratose 2-epimerase
MQRLRQDYEPLYGCSKGAMDQYMLDYVRIFGLKTIVFRHSPIFGGRQFSTLNQGLVGWFIKQALLIRKGVLSEPFTIAGNGKQVRDVLFANDLISCYLQAVEHIDKTRGQVFNIGGGIRNSYSLLKLFTFIENELGIEMDFRQLPWRESDQQFFVADTEKAYQAFVWGPKIDKEEGVRRMITWVEEFI